MLLTVTSVKYVESATDLGEVNTPTRGIYARVAMTATNAGPSPGIFDYANMVWVSPAGEVIPGTDALGARPDSIPTTTLQPGQHVSGVAFYDVSAKGGQLEYGIYTGQPPLITITLPPG
jgi:hypothetical protein